MSKDIHNPEAVNGWMAAFEHPLKDVAEAARQAILQANPLIGEQVKWNSPAFFYTGDMPEYDAREYKRDLVVFHLRKKDQVLLVFPNGAVVPDETGLLEGNYTDGRRMLTLKSMADFENKKAALQTALKLIIDKIIHP